MTKYRLSLVLAVIVAYTCFVITITSMNIQEVSSQEATGWIVDTLAVVSVGWVILSAWWIVIKNELR